MFRLIFLLEKGFIRKNIKFYLGFCILEIILLYSESFDKINSFMDFALCYSKFHYLINIIQNIFALSFLIFITLNFFVYTFRYNVTYLSSRVSSKRMFFNVFIGNILNVFVIYLILFLLSFIMCFIFKLDIQVNHINLLKVILLFINIANIVPLYYLKNKEFLSLLSIPFIIMYVINDISIIICIVFILVELYLYLKVLKITDLKK